MSTATASPPARSLPVWLKASLATAIVFAACWASAIWYWRANGQVPATSHLLLLLLVLPLSLMTSLWAGHKLFSRKPAVQASATLAPAPAKDAATERRAPTLAIVATSLRMPHGASTEAFSAALAASQAHAELDQELTDDSGFPIMSARSIQAVDEALKEDIAEWLAANAMAELHLSDEQWRALILGTATLRDLAEHAAAMLVPDAGDTPTLQLMPVLPPEWQAAQRQAASAWWRHTLVQCGWPASHIALGEQQADPQARIDATPPAALLARLAHVASASPKPLATILLASASHICQETVDRWSASELLFTPAHPQGQVPGEGAAGLLLADARLAQAMDVADLTYLDLECEACDPAFASQKRISPKLLGKLAERALQGAAIPALEVAMIVADTGPDTRLCSS